MSRVFATQVFLILLAPLSCFSQKLEFGAKVGVPITEAFQTGSFFTSHFGEGAHSATRRYAIGPMLGLRLPHDFGLEFDALYGRLGFDRDVRSAVLLNVHTRATAASWEFPLLGKYRFSKMPFLKPYVGAGVSFRKVSGTSVLSVTSVGSDVFKRVSQSSDPALDNRAGKGGVFGFGAELHIGVLRISPEIRYTRWAADSNLDSQLYSNQNQVAFLLGVAF